MNLHQMFDSRNGKDENASAAIQPFGRPAGPLAGLSVVGRAAFLSPTGLS